MKLSREYKLYAKESKEFLERYLELVRSDYLYLLLNDFENYCNFNSVDESQKSEELKAWLSKSITLSEEALEILDTELNEN